MEDTIEPSALDQLKQWLSSSRQELKDAGVVAIIGAYSGEGDDGRFEEIRVIGEDEQDIDYKLPESVEGLIEQLEPELAPQGYENGDGGGGEFQLVVARGRSPTSRISFPSRGCITCRRSIDGPSNRTRKIKRPEVRRQAGRLPGHPRLLRRIERAGRGLSA